MVRAFQHPEHVRYRFCEAFDVSNFLRTLNVAHFESRSAVNLIEGPAARALLYAECVRGLTKLGRAENLLFCS